MMASFGLARAWLAAPPTSADDGAGKLRAAEAVNPGTSRLPTTDRILLARIQQGDVAAFTELFQAHWTPLCAVAAMYTHDMAEAEEIVAAILGDVWERRADLRIAVKIRTYLHAAVKHRTLDWRRARARRAELLQRALPDEAPGLGEAAIHPDVAMERTDLIRHILAALRTLPERYQLAFVYRWQHGWDYADIAATLGISHDAAKKAVSRALAMIRAQVGDSSS